MYHVTMANRASRGRSAKRRGQALCAEVRTVVTMSQIETQPQCHVVKQIHECTKYSGTLL
jgi:ribosomal protein L32